MEEERIGLFIDYENLAIGAREDLGIRFDFKPIADALAERGRVVVRRAYADWTRFEQEVRMLVDSQVELIEIPQRRGAVRKNAADIKMAVDAIELAFERAYVTTFAILTGDSDFTPLVHKLRELNKRVVGVGLKASTSALLPAACDEFLFYENLDGVDLPVQPSKRKERAAKTDDAEEETRQGATPDLDALAPLVTQTLAGLQRSTGAPVRSSSLKRALLRKDPTFNEGDYGFRAFGEVLRHLGERRVIELSDESSIGDPVVRFPESGRGEEEAFTLLHDVVADHESKQERVVLSGLKNEMRRRQPGFTEKRHGYTSFLQFVKAAQARGSIELARDEDDGDYVLHST